MRQLVGLPEDVQRRHPGHGLDLDAGRADLRPRKGERFLARPRRPRRRSTRRSSSTAPRRPIAPSTRRRCSRASAATTCAMSKPTRPTPSGRKRWRRRSAPTSPPAAGPPPSSPRVGTTGVTAIDPVAADRGDRQGARAVAACRCGDGGFGDDPAGDAPALGGDRGRGFAGVQSAQMARRRVRLLALLRARSPASHARHGHQPELSRQPRRRRCDELSRLGHPARPPFPGAEAVVPVARRGRRGACRRGCGAISTSRNGWRPKSRGRRTGACWRPCRCRPSASATSRRGSKARRSTATRWPGRIALTVRARLMSRRPCSMGAGWCGCRSARCRPKRRHVEAFWAQARREAEGA